MIEERLNALQTWRQNGHELILVDGGSQDDTVHIATGKADQILISAAGRALQMNAGAKMAKKKVLLFLHIDTQLPSGADKNILDVCQKFEWGRFDVKFTSERFIFKIIALMMNWRSRTTHIATGDQCLFFDRQVFEKIGGFPEIPLMEDIAISKIIKKYHKPACLYDKVTTSSRRWEEQGVIFVIIKMWYLRFFYFLGVSPDNLVRKY